MFKFRQKKEDMPQIKIEITPSIISIWDENNKLVLSEPAVIATDTETKKIVAVGNDVDSAISVRVYPKNVHVSEPFRIWLMQESKGENGEYLKNYLTNREEGEPISDEVLFAKSDFHNDIETFIEQKEMNNIISAYLNKAFGKSKYYGVSAKVVLSAGFYDEGRERLREAFGSCGIKAVSFAERPIELLDRALDYYDTNEYNVVADIDEELMDLVLLRGNEIVYRKSLPKGTKDIVADIQYYVRKEFLAVMPEGLTIKILNMIRSDETSEDEFIEVRMRDLVSGIPKDYKLPRGAIEEVIDSGISKLYDFVKLFFDEMSKEGILTEEALANIGEKGIIYAGPLYTHGIMRERSHRIIRKTKNDTSET